MDEARTENSPEPEEGSTRRGFLGLTAMIGAIVGAMVGIPAGTLFAAPLLRLGKGAGDTWVPIGSANEYGEDRRDVEYRFQRVDGWYTASQVRRVSVAKVSDTEWSVLSTRCTHAGCGVTWKPEEKVFYCPCHDGEFNADGTVKKGPPDSPLVRLEARRNEQTDQLEVRES